MIFVLILPFISPKAAKFAVQLGVKIGQVVLGAAREAAVVVRDTAVDT